MMPQTAHHRNDSDDTPQARRRMAQVRLALIVAASVSAAPVSAQHSAPAIVTPPFTATLSNTAPLAFGMDALEAERALGMPLNYVGGRPGDEVFLAIRTAGGSGFFNRRDRLYLQFRHGRLTGWKGDWGRNWMWQ